MQIKSLQNIIIFIFLAIGIHLIFESLVRPEAQIYIESANKEGKSLPRNFVVLIKDIEQEICIILMFLGIYLMLSKMLSLISKSYLFKVDFLENMQKDKVSAEKAIEQLEKLPKDISNTPLLQTLKASLRRYLITEDVQNTSDAISMSVENLGAQLETDNTMIRYLIWAIPSIGFIGTVRGIGQALSEADKALTGDIASMAESLGVAFNSTFIALLISILLMFLLHQLQKIEDGLLIEIQTYCERFLLNRISR